MPDEAVTTPTPSPATPPPAPSPGSFAMPEKFANKSAEDIAKSYIELESKFGETSGKLKGLESYTKIGTPEQISEAIEYARNLKAAIDRGLLIPKDQAAPQAPQAPSNKKPWEEPDWAYKSPQEQFEAMSQKLLEENKSYIDNRAAEFANQFQSLTAQDGKQKDLLLKAISAAIKNPGTDPNTILTKAAELGSKPADELLNMALESLTNTPEAQEKRINELVAQRMAEKIQEYEAKQLADVMSVASPTPRGLQSRMAEKNGFQAREKENRQVIENLQKQGIRLV